MHPGGFGALRAVREELPRRLDELQAWRDRSVAVLRPSNRNSGEAVRRLREAGFRCALLVSDGMTAWGPLRFPADLLQ